MFPPKMLFLNCISFTAMLLHFFSYGDIQYVLSSSFPSHLSKVSAKTWQRIPSESVSTKCKGIQCNIDRKSESRTSGSQRSTACPNSGANSGFNSGIDTPATPASEDCPESIEEGKEGNCTNWTPVLRLDNFLNGKSKDPQEPQPRDLPQGQSRDPRHSKKEEVWIEVDECGCRVVKGVVADVEDCGKQDTDVHCCQNDEKQTDKRPLLPEKETHIQTESYFRQSKPKTLSTPIKQPPIKHQQYQIDEIKSQPVKDEELQKKVLQLSTFLAKVNKSNYDRRARESDLETERRSNAEAVDAWKQSNTFLDGCGEGDIASRTPSPPTPQWQRKNHDYDCMSNKVGENANIIHSVNTFLDSAGNNDIASRTPSPPTPQWQRKNYDCMSNPIATSIPVVVVSTPIARATPIATPIAIRMTHKNVDDTSDVVPPLLQPQPIPKALNPNIAIGAPIHTGTAPIHTLPMIPIHSPDSSRQTASSNTNAAFLTHDRPDVERLQPSVTTNVDQYSDLELLASFTRPQHPPPVGDAEEQEMEGEMGCVDPINTIAVVDFQNAVDAVDRQGAVDCQSVIAAIKKELCNERDEPENEEPDEPKSEEPEHEECLFGIKLQTFSHNSPERNYQPGEEPEESEDPGVVVFDESAHNHMVARLFEEKENADLAKKKKTDLEKEDAEEVRLRALLRLRAEGSAGEEGSHPHVVEKPEQSTVYQDERECKPKPHPKQKADKCKSSNTRAKYESAILPVGLQKKEFQHAEKTSEEAKPSANRVPQPTVSNTPTAPTYAQKQPKEQTKYIRKLMASGKSKYWICEQCGWYNSENRKLCIGRSKGCCKGGMHPDTYKELVNEGGMHLGLAHGKDMGMDLEGLKKDLGTSEKTRGDSTSSDVAVGSCSSSSSDTNPKHIENQSQVESSATADVGNQSQVEPAVAVNENVETRPDDNVMDVYSADWANLHGDCIPRGHRISQGRAYCILLRDRSRTSDHEVGDDGETGKDGEVSTEPQPEVAKEKNENSPKSSGTRGSTEISDEVEDMEGETEENADEETELQPQMNEAEKTELEFLPNEAIELSTEDTELPNETHQNNIHQNKTHQNETHYLTDTHPADSQTPFSPSRPITPHFGTLGVDDEEDEEDHEEDEDKEMHANAENNESREATPNARRALAQEFLSSREGDLETESFEEQVCEDEPTSCNLQ